MRQTGEMCSDKKRGSMANMKAGDVLISHSSAVSEHEISIVPEAPHSSSANHDPTSVEGDDRARLSANGGCSVGPHAGADGAFGLALGGLVLLTRRRRTRRPPS